MSYVRFGEDGSDVYVFTSDRGLECCGCSLSNGFVATATDDMTAHLERHTAEGDHVPNYVIPDLKADNAENFPQGDQS